MKKKTGTQQYITFEILGEVVDIYNGAHVDYLTVKVQPDPDDYYDTYRVSVKKDSGIEKGDTLKLTGTCSSFFNKNKKVMEYSFHASEYEEV